MEPWSPAANWCVLALPVNCRLADEITYTLTPVYGRPVGESAELSRVHRRRTELNWTDLREVDPVTRRLLVSRVSVAKLIGCAAAACSSRSAVVAVQFSSRAVNMALASSRDTYWVSDANFHGTGMPDAPSPANTSQTLSCHPVTSPWKKRRRWLHWWQVADVSSLEYSAHLANFYISREKREKLRYLSTTGLHRI